MDTKTGKTTKAEDRATRRQRFAYNRRREMLRDQETKRLKKKQRTLDTRNTAPSTASTTAPPTTPEDNKEESNKAEEDNKDETMKNADTTIEDAPTTTTTAPTTAPTTAQENEDGRDNQDQELLPVAVKTKDGWQDMSMNELLNLKAIEEKKELPTSSRNQEDDAKALPQEIEALIPRISGNTSPQHVSPLQSQPLQRPGAYEKLHRYSHPAPNSEEERKLIWDLVDEKSWDEAVFYDISKFLFDLRDVADALHIYDDNEDGFIPFNTRLTVLRSFMHTTFQKDKFLKNVFACNSESPTLKRFMTYLGFEFPFKDNDDDDATVNEEDLYDLDSDLPAE